MPVALRTGRWRGSDGLLRTSLVTLSASVLGALVNFALAVVVGRGHGTADTGVFFAVVGAFLVAATTVRLGADTGMVRFMARLPALGRSDDLSAALAVGVVPVLVLSGTVAAGMGFGSDLIAEWLFSGSEAGSALVRTLACFLPVMAVLPVFTSAIRGLGSPGTFVLLQNLALPVTRFLGVAGATAWGLGITGVTGWWAAGLPVLLLVAVGLCRQRLNAATGAQPAVSWRARPNDRVRPVAGEFWRFCGPRAAGAVLEIVLEWLDVVLIALLAGAREAGIYAVATRLVKVSMIVDQAMRVTVATRISRWLALDRHQDVDRLYRATTTVMVALVWPYLTCLVVFGETVLGAFGSGFTESRTVLAVLALGMAVFTAAGSLQSILLMGGHSAAQLTNKSLSLSLCVLANLALTPSWGAIGAAAAWTATICLDTALAAWQVRRRVGVRVGPGPVLAVGPLAVVAVAAPGLFLRQLTGPTPGALLATAICAAGVIATALVRRGILLQIKDIDGNDG